MSAPLDGILVVALEQAVAAPLATCRLADAGARVIKIERPEGDFARGYDVAAGGVSSYFAWLNRGKESIALDLREDADRRVLERIIAKADVFVQNLAVGAADRLGFGAETLRARHPGLVVCEISGYGDEGPYATAKAYDLLVQAESGLLSVSGPPGPLGRVGVSLVDIGTGLNAAMAVMEALYRTARTGEGAHVHCSLFDSIAEWMTVPLLHHDVLGAAPGRVGLAHPTIAPYGAFDTSDGAAILISIQSDREWVILCREVLGDEQLAADPAFATNNLRVARRDDTDRAVQRRLGAMTADEARERLAQARIAFGNINDVAGLSSHPHLRRIAVEHEHGSVALPASAIRSDWERSGRAPAIDEHGAAIRAEFAD